MALPVFRDDLTEGALAHKSVRSALANLPGPIQHLLVNTGTVGGLKIDVNERKIVKILRSKDTSKIFFVTSVLEKNGKLYFGSLLSETIGVMTLPKEEINVQGAETVGEEADQNVEELVAEP